MKLSIKSDFRQPRKSTTSTFQQSSSQISIPLVESLLKLIYPQILQIQNTSFDIIKNKVKNKFLVKKCSKQNKYIHLFMNHCAILIQSNFKGFIQRKKYKKFLPIYRRFKQIFVASIKGWKTRKILSLTAMKKQKSQIIKNVQLKKQKEVRIAKRQYIDDFNRLFKNGNWIQTLRKQSKYDFKGVQIVKKNTQWKGKNPLLYDNIKAVTNLRNFLKIQKKKTQQIVCNQNKNKDFIKNKHQNKSFNNQKQNLKNDKKKQKIISQFDKTIKNSKLSGKIQNQKSQSKQSNRNNVKIKNSAIKLKGKLIQNQLQIYIEPQFASKTDSFATPKYSQNLLRPKRSLNVGNSQNPKNYLETLNKDQKQNNINNINDKQPFDKQIHSIKEDRIKNQQDQRLINFVIFQILFITTKFIFVNYFPLQTLLILIDLKIKFITQDFPKKNHQKIKQYIQQLAIIIIINFNFFSVSFKQFYIYTYSIYIHELKFMLYKKNDKKKALE